MKGWMISDLIKKIEEGVAKRKMELVINRLEELGIQYCESELKTKIRVLFGDDEPAYYFDQDDKTLVFLGIIKVSYIHRTPANGEPWITKIELTLKTK